MLYHCAYYFAALTYTIYIYYLLFPKPKYA